MQGRETSLRGLMNIGRQLVTELDPESVLERLLAEARAATGARYAALGVLNQDRTELGRFLHLGVDDATVRTIGELPRGRGVLGVLIETPEPLRLEEVGQHEQSFGFPVGHPDMHSFLGVPIVIRGEAWGNLYLAEKEGGEPFSESDEDAAAILAEWAATAIDNARIHSASEERRKELERAVRGLDAARNIADAIGAEPDLDRVLELIVKRGRALIGARAVLILMCEGDELVLLAGAGQIEDLRGRRIPVAGTTSGEVLKDGRPLRVNDARRLKMNPEQLGVPNARSALLVPMVHRGEGLGVLLAFDRGSEMGAFTAADESLMRTFGASAANAVAISRSVEADRLRATIAAAESERRRWARELHDETLQALGGLRVLLSGAIRRDDAERTKTTVLQAIADIESEIENLRSIITELRPMLLDDLGLGPALDALVERRRGDSLTITTDLRLPEPDAEPLSPELETTIYRLVQESLTNVVKHARATEVKVGVDVSGHIARVTVIDNGRGFDTSQAASGFGLDGIRERVYLANGYIAVSSAPGEGTAVRAKFPLSGRNLADEVTAEDDSARSLR
jgi:signal transduction histidine kinase